MWYRGFFDKIIIVMIIRKIKDRVYSSKGQDEKECMEKYWNSRPRGWQTIDSSLLLWPILALVTRLYPLIVVTA